MLATSLPSLRARRPAAPTFTRSGVAYDPYTGAAYADGQPRFPVVDGRQGVMVEEGGANLLTANQSSFESGLDGTYVSNAATRTQDTSTVWTGSASLKVVTDGLTGNEGFALYSTDVTASNPYTASVYLRGAGTLRVQILERNASDAIVGTTTNTVTLTDQWIRYSVTRTFGATGVKARIAIITDGTASTTFWADGLQLEQKPYPTSWTLGGTTRNAETLTIPTAGVLNLSQGAIIVPFYADGELTNATMSRGYHLFDSRGVANVNLFNLARGPGGAWIAYLGSTSQSVSYSATLTRGRHVAGMCWNGSRFGLWLDGVEVAGVDNPTLPTAAEATAAIGSINAGTGNWFNHPIFSTHILRGWSDSLMAQFTSGSPIPRTPYHSLYLPLDTNLATYGRGFGIQDMVALGLA